MVRFLTEEEGEQNSYHHNDLASLVSVIIPAMNSSKTIGKCLESVIKQTYKNIEIFVVDRFSSDDTTKIASKFNANVLSIDGERTKAKNLGISKSRGEFLFFIDSDMVLEPRVIEECVAICSTGDKIAGVIIPEHSIGSGFWVRVRDFERGLYAGSQIESARFFRKKFVIAVGGFDEDAIIFEESTLPQKIENIGMRVDARIRSFILHDEEDFRLVKWLYKKHYYSTTIPFYSKKYKKAARIQTSIFQRIKLFIVNGNWKILMRHPLLSTGVFILKSLEVFVGIKGVTCK
jgi:glycosyltransferase involved in cell wall biosynthesis